MSSGNWKAVERGVAKILGGERVPITGRQRGSAPDIAHKTFSIEVKNRKSLPDWMHDAMAQAEASVRGEQLPIAIFHEVGQEYGKSFVMIRLQDFQDWYGNVQEEVNIED